MISAIMAVARTVSEITATQLRQPQRAINDDGQQQAHRLAAIAAASVGVVMPE